jgi:Ca-activated chloride channel family protein
LTRTKNIKTQEEYNMKQIKIDLALDRYALQPGNKQVAYLMIKMTAPEEIKEDRPAQNLSFVIDRSGSMYGDKLEYTKKAVAFAIGHLDPQDHCSVVAFDDMVSLVAPSQVVENKDALKQAVMSIYPGGCTNLSGGMLQGLREVKLAFRKEQVNRVLLLTDGQANAGITDHARLIKKAAEMAGGGVTISTFGLGADFEEDLLLAMAEAGGGNSHYIQSPDQIPGIFEQELSGLLSTVAQNLTVKLKTGKGVKVSGVLGYPFSAGDGIAINLPDIYGGETKIVLVELLVSPHKEGSHKLLDLELEYFDVRKNLALVSANAMLEAKFTAQPGKGPAENLEVVKHVELFRCAEAKEEAIRLADQGDFEGSRNVLNQQLANMSKLVQMVDDAELAEEVRELGVNISSMSDVSYDQASRKQMSYNAYKQKRGRKGNG